MNERDLTRHRYAQKLVMLAGQRPRGWPGKPRDCMTCVHKPEEVKYEFQAREHCNADDIMDGSAPCDYYEPTKKERFKRWIKRS